MTSSTFNGNVAFTYDAAGRPRTEARPDNTTLTWDHYPDDQLKSLVVAKTSPAAELTRWEYNYTNAGQQKTQAMTGATVSAGAGTFRYTYDTAGRLASFQHGAAAAKNVRFDGDGNRTQYDNEYFDYRADDSLGTQKTGPAGTPVAAAYFDWGGQRSPDGQRTCFTHDGFDRLKTAGTAAVTGNCAGTVTNNATYTYDGLDRQRSRAETVAGTTELHYDGLTSDVVVEKSVTAATDSTYLLGPAGTRHAVTAPLSSLAYYRFWLSDDGHGNISTLTDQSAAITCAARFDPYGTPINPVNPAAGQEVCHTGTNANTADQSTINDFFYRGGRRDDTTDTYQFGARTYNPKQATFLTPDTYRSGDSATNLSVGVDPLTRNSYSYVNGDPINLYDPTGHHGRYHAQQQRVGNDWTRPLEERYAANRFLARHEARRLRAAWTPRQEHLNPRLRALDRLGHEKSARQILYFDPTGDDAKIIEVFGDLRGSDNISVVIDGTGQNLGNFDTGVAAKARRIKAAADRLDGGSTATIAWLGDDVPNAPRLGVNRSPATRAGKRLVGFVGRLRGINAGAHYSAVGHSYGSVILGEAMSRGLAVDDIVLTGSPGINANSIAETGFRGSVYVGCAAEERGFNLAPFGWDVHGREPCNIEDAFLFDTGRARGHSQYYDTGSTSLRNIAKIVVGKGEGYQ